MKSFGVLVQFAEVDLVPFQEVGCVDENDCKLSSVPVKSSPIRLEDAQACASCFRPGVNSLERADMLLLVAVVESGTEAIMSDQTSKRARTNPGRMQLICHRRIWRREQG
jgi:hypothetical protein